MKEPIIRLQELELTNFKNTLSGIVSMPSCFKKNYFDYTSDILGLYGQNGTGKTSVVEALYLMKLLLSGDKIKPDYTRYIAKGAKECSMRVVFLVEAGQEKSKVEYEVHLHRLTEEESDHHHAFITQESLNYAQWDEAAEKFKRKTELFRYDATEPKVFAPKNVYQLCVKNHSERQMEIALAIAVAQNNKTSLIANKRAIELLSSFKEEKIVYLQNTIQALKKFASCDLFVILHEQLSVAHGSRGVPFYLRQEQGGEVTVGDILIQLGEPHLIEHSQFVLVCGLIKSINRVLDSIIPQLQIELRNLGSEFDKKGDKLIRVQLLSLRGEVLIPLKYESSGIIKIVSILSALLQVFHLPSACLVVDELDAGVFEYLLGEILKTLDQSAKGQLIFTSHNLRALEMLPKESLMFSTINPHNRYIRMKNVKKNNNLRDQYYRAILLGGQDEELYMETDSLETSKAFRQALAQWED